MAEQVKAGRSILRRRKVEDRTGLSRTSIYAKIARGEFPPAVSLGARAVGWYSDDIDKWIDDRAASRKGAA